MTHEAVLRERATGDGIGRKSEYEAVLPRLRTSHEEMGSGAKRCAPLGVDSVGVFLFLTTIKTDQGKNADITIFKFE
jgi:hypothetical protein